MRMSSSRFSVLRDCMRNKLIMKVGNKSNPSLGSTKFKNLFPRVQTSYSNHYFLTNRSPVFKKLSKTQTQTPGPGQYTWKEDNSSKGTTIPKGPRGHLKSVTETPGVGSYHMKTQQSPSFTFKSASDPRLRTIPTPGPGNYTMKPQRSAKSVKIGKGARFDRFTGYMKCETTPGPGAYEANPGIKQPQAKPSKGQTRTRASTNSLFSEIDSYQSFLNLQNRGKIMPKFRQSERKFEFLDPLNVFSPTPVLRSPGPAQYNTRGKIQQKLSRFSKQSRPEVFFIPKTPGVGEYSHMPVFGKIYKPRKKIETDPDQVWLRQLFQSDQN